MSVMTAAEMIVLEKERILQLHNGRTPPNKPAPQAASYIKNLKLFVEQLHSRTAYSAPLKKHDHITDAQVLRYTRGNYKYAYRGAENCTLSAVAFGLLFKTEHGLFFYIYSKDKVVRMPSNMKRNVPEHRWIAVQQTPLVDNGV